MRVEKPKRKRKPYGQRGAYRKRVETATRKSKPTGNAEPGKEGKIWNDEIEGWLSGLDGQTQGVVQMYLKGEPMHYIGIKCGMGINEAKRIIISAYKSR
jgi:hypothetical protein